jgi:restriction endonuclease Mrr
LSILQNIPPDAFERLCQRLLRESGFIKVEVTGRKGDGGIDGIGVLKIALLTSAADQGASVKKWCNLWYVTPTALFAI